jgi:hypothetical protein
MVVFVSIFLQLILIIVYVNLHIRVVIVKSKSSNALTLHVVIEHQKSNHYVTSSHLIWLLIIRAVVISSIHLRIWFWLWITVRTKISCLIPIVAQRNQLGQCRILIKAFISVLVISLQRLYNHVRWIMYGITHERNVF